nr:hypothetical protein GCM10025732_02450 [Glycomyces mayteni]
MGLGFGRVHDGAERAPAEEFGADAAPGAAVGDLRGHAHDGVAAGGEERGAVEGPREFGFGARRGAVGQAGVVAVGEAVVAPVLDVERRVAHDQVVAFRRERGEERIAHVHDDFGLSDGAVADGSAAALVRVEEPQAPFGDGGAGAGEVLPGEDRAGAELRGGGPEEVPFVAGGVVQAHLRGGRGVLGADGGGGVGEGPIPGGTPMPSASRARSMKNSKRSAPRVSAASALTSAARSPSPSKAAATASRAASAVGWSAARRNQSRSAPVTLRSRPWAAAQDSKAGREKRGRRAESSTGAGKSGSRRRQLLTALRPTEARRARSVRVMVSPGPASREVMRAPVLIYRIVTHPALRRLDTVY